jgi:hypothetical protein
VKPTLAQFFPKEKGQLQSDDGLSSSFNKVSCNMAYISDDADSSESEVVLTSQEREEFLAEDSIAEGKAEEVNMNLRGGKEF